MSGSLPIFDVKSYPRNIGRKYAFVACIDPHEILSKSKSDVVLSKTVIYIQYSENIRKCYNHLKFWNF